MYSYTMEKLPFVSMTGKVEQKPGYGHNGRELPVNLMVFAHSGSCVFETALGEYPCEAGDIALIPRGVHYRVRVDEPCEYTFFHFDGDFLPDAPAQKRVSDEPQNHNALYGPLQPTKVPLLFGLRMPGVARLPEVEILLYKCLEIQLRSDEKLSLLLSIRFSELLYQIAHGYGESVQYCKEQYPAVVNRMLIYINNHYREPIRLDDICGEVLVSKQYAMRVFKQHIGSTVNDYILATRMRHAAYLLCYTYMNVSEAASYLGFSGVSYFSRVFKNYFGVAPSDYHE